MGDIVKCNIRYNEEITKNGIAENVNCLYNLIVRNKCFGSGEAGTPYSPHT